MQVLELVAANQPISLAELVSRLQQPKSTVQRCVATLKNYGWIKPETPEGNPKWILSNRFLSLTSNHHLVYRLSQLARPHLIEIRNLSEETTFLSAYDVDTMTVIDYAESTHLVRLVGAIGGNIPAVRSSTGKACLARLTDKQVTRVLAKSLGLEANLSLETLLGELRVIRDQGYALIEGEWSSELTHLGAAITDSNGYPIGGIGISVPNHRFLSLDVSSITSALVSGCAEVSAALPQLFTSV